MKEIKVPDKVKVQMQVLLTQKTLAESNLNIYIQGYMDSLDLDGNWNLDTTKWTLTKIPEEEKAK